MTEAGATSGLPGLAGRVGWRALVAPQGRERLLPGTRAWFVFFLVWMTGWAVLALLSFDASERGHALGMSLWALALMCFYLSLCNTFVPLPTAWVILLAASPGFALVQTPWLCGLVVAVVSALATVVANLNEYHVLAYVFRFGLGRRLRRTQVYGWAVRWFDRSPFQLLSVIAFMPLPVDAVRWLSVLRGYSRLRFGLAYFVGRVVRYGLFAACSVGFELGPRGIVLIQVGLVAAALAARVLWWLVRRARRARGVRPRTGETTLEAAACESGAGRAGTYRR